MANPLSAEQAREEAERGRRLAEDARIVGEEGRIAAEHAREAAMDAMHDTAESLEATVAHMEVVEEMGRTLRGIRDLNKQTRFQLVRPGWRYLVLGLLDRQRSPSPEEFVHEALEVRRQMLQDRQPRSESPARFRFAP